MKIIPNHYFNHIVTDNDFVQFYNNNLIGRIKLISYILLFSYPCFFIVDFFLLKGMHNRTYVLVLTIIHFTGFLNSLLFITFYKYIMKLNKNLIINSYVSFYLLLGALTSINSQLFTGNLVAYLVILIGVAVILPIRPRTLFLIMTGIHLSFLISLSFVEKSYFTLLIKQINSTGTAVIAFIIIFTFYSYRKQDFMNQSKLKEQERSFRRLFHINPSPLILMNAKNNQIVLMNKQAVDYYQLQSQDITDLNGSFLFKNEQEKWTILQQLHEKQNIENYVSKQHVSPQGIRWAMLHFELIEYLDDECLLISLTDITSLKEAEEVLFKQATIDMLTGVMNRRCGLELLQKKISRPSSEEFILCYIDINNLKTVNDQYGHSMGDDLIHTACTIIKNRIESTDVLFRLGGDEFVIVFFQKPKDDVKQIWNSITQEFQSINQTQQKPYSISASHGLYHYKPGTSNTLEEMLELADKEMYKEKYICKMSKYIL